jgi:hypothetical protein
MTAEEVIAAKLLKTWPKSWALWEKSCKYSIDNNLDFVKGALLYNEHDVPYNEQNSIGEQLRIYLNYLGYKNSIIIHKDTFLMEDGYYHATVFIAFLSEAAMLSYLEENKKWAKSIEGNMRGQVQAPRPIYDSIKNVNLFEKPKKKKI